jgi:hypothetical protein
MEQLWDQLKGTHVDLDEPLVEELRGQLPPTMARQLDGRQQVEIDTTRFCANAFWGQPESAELARHLFASEIGVAYRDDQRALLSAWTSLSESCFWWAPWEKLCIVSDRPRFLSFDDRRRLHHESGPALRFADGSRVYALEGCRVSDFVVEHPREITVAMIDHESSHDRQRVLVDRYLSGADRSGVAAYLEDAGAELLDRDDRLGTLWRRAAEGDKPIVILAVRQGLPGRDGGRPRQWQRIPPQIATSEEAWRWSNGRQKIRRCGLSIIPSTAASAPTHDRMEGSH